MARAATTTDAFTAIGEEIRRDILVVLRDGEAAVGDIVERLALSQPQTSRHLGVLRTVGLVQRRSVGKRRLYRVNAAALRPVDDWVRSFESLWNDRLDRLDDLLIELQLGDSE